jgi:hypothetical protein
MSPGMMNVQQRLSDIALVDVNHALPATSAPFWLEDREKVSIHLTLITDTTDSNSEMR